MPTKQGLAWPVRGTPGGWIDDWDDPDAVAAAQEQAARGAAVTERIAAAWRAASAAQTAGGQHSSPDRGKRLVAAPLDPSGGR